MKRLLAIVVSLLLLTPAAGSPESASDREIEAWNRFVRSWNVEIELLRELNLSLQARPPGRFRDLERERLLGRVIEERERQLRCLRVMRQSERE